MKYQASVDLPLSASEYFEEKDSAAFLALLAKMQNLKDMSVVNSQPDEAGNDIIHVITNPDLDAYVPKSLQRFISFDPAVHDFMVYKKDKVAGPSYEFTTTSTIPALGTKQFSNTYDVKIEPVAPGHCRSTITGTVKIKMMAVGGTAERITADSIVKGYSLMKEVLTRWCDFREKVLSSPGGRAALLEGRPDLTVIPKEAMEVFKKPYEELAQFAGSVVVDGAEKEVEKAKATLTRMESSMYFDAVDDLFPEDIDDITKAQCQEDALHLLVEAAVQEQEELQPISLGDDNSETTELEVETSGSSATRLFFEKMKQRDAKVKEDWHNAFMQWKGFWDGVEMEKPKVPNVATRISCLINQTYRLGLLGRGSQSGDEDGTEGDKTGICQRYKARTGNLHQSIRNATQHMKNKSTQVKSDMNALAFSFKSLVTTGTVTPSGGSSSSLGSRTDSGDALRTSRSGSVSGLVSDGSGETQPARPRLKDQLKSDVSGLTSSVKALLKTGTGKGTAPPRKHSF